MTWLWLDLLDEPPAAAVASVGVRDATDDRPAGFLTFFAQDRNSRPGHALRVDGRFLPVEDGGVGSASEQPPVERQAPPEGPRAERDHRDATTSTSSFLSWCRMDEGHSLAFDDGAVSAAIRRCLAQPWPGAVSTLLLNWSRIAGAVTAAPTRALALDDPFARVFPRRLLRLDVPIAPMPAPTGPCITRYGSGNPWPWDRYTRQEP